MKERNVGIDILKFLAVLFITNSHMDMLYSNYSALATGGTIGDVLFFFCSGFTLLMKPITSIKEFPNWYKRRINRIFPTIFAVSIISCLFFNNHADIISIIFHSGGWFISCIMIYYVFIYLIGLYSKNRINTIIVVVSLMSIIWFYIIDRPFPFNMYADEGGYLKWLLYFNFMLLGAKLGINEQRHTDCSSRYLLYAFVGIVLFYLIYVGARKVQSVEFLEVFNFIPLLFAIYYLYLWANSASVKKLYNSKCCHFLIRFVGGLCLEIYLIQNYIISDMLNAIFPLNILLFFIVIVLAAYLTRCLSRLLLQTFRDSPYDWKKIVTKY